MVVIIYTRAAVMPGLTRHPAVVGKVAFNKVLQTFITAQSDAGSGPA